jgi:hypothetical protein
MLDEMKGYLGDAVTAVKFGYSRFTRSLPSAEGLRFALYGKDSQPDARRLPGYEGAACA